MGLLYKMCKKIISLGPFKIDVSCIECVLKLMMYVCE